MSEKRTLQRNSNKYINKTQIENSKINRQNSSVLIKNSNKKILKSKEFRSLKSNRLRTLKNFDSNNKLKLEENSIRTKVKSNLETKKSFKSERKNIRKNNNKLLNNRRRSIKNLKNFSKNQKFYYTSSVSSTNDLNKDVQRDLKNDFNRFKSIKSATSKLENRRNLKINRKKLKERKIEHKKNKKVLKKKYKEEKKELKNEIYNNLKNKSNYSLYNKAKVETTFRKERGLAHIRNAKDNTIRTIKKPVVLSKNIANKTTRTLKGTKKFLKDRKFRKKKLKDFKNSTKKGIKNFFKNIFKKSKEGFINLNKYIARNLIKYVLIVMLPAILLFSCFNGGTALSSTSYTTHDESALEIEDYFKKKELELQLKVEKNEIQKYKKGDKGKYDGEELEIESVNYNIAPIGHIPEELLAYLTLIHKQKSFDFKEKELDEIFERMYKYYDELKLRKFEYIKEVEVEDGEGNKVKRQTKAFKFFGTYNVNLSKKDFSFLISEDFSNEAEWTKGANFEDVMKMFNEIVNNRGSWQILVSPFKDQTWLSRNPEMQGYYIKDKQIKYRDYEDTYFYLDCKKGEDIYTLNGFDYSSTKVNYYENKRDGILELIIDDTTKIYLKGVEATVQNGEVVRNISKEDEKTKKPIKQRAKIGKASGEKIGIIIKKENINPKTGKKFGWFSTKSSELYVNPYMYLSLSEKEKDKYQEYVLKTKGEGEYHLNGSAQNVPSLKIDNETVKKIVQEANKHLGKRYVFGANGPANFDCSSFVCWVYTHAGVKKMPRTTAWLIYKNYCNPVSPSEAKAGDIIFFKNTYNSGEPISHVGIYVGNGYMIHAGDPIQYSRIDTPYWKQHFYSFGRPKQ